MAVATRAPTSNARSQRPSYRPDIDGLRAIAVLGVVFYHFGIGTSGYVGVDIFFVISGFLITRLLLRELQQGDFTTANLAHFYERRIRRIAPALTAMCLATFIAATLWLFPDDFKEFVKSLQSVAIFTSNFFFERKTGYFDGAADEKPLLHTWSLAVEEQYYLVFPLLLWALWRWGGRRSTVAVLATITLVSFAYSASIVETAPAKAFFSTFSRIWELLVGALIAIVRHRAPSNRTINETMAAAAIATLAWVYLTYSAATPFPGIYAAPPVLAAALLIVSGINAPTTVSRFLATPPMVAIGLMSYSIYLWHWPLLVMIKYRFAPDLEAQQLFVKIALLTATLLLGFLSWRFVEQPFRRPSHPKQRRNVFAAQLGLTLAFIAAAFVVLRLDGIPERWPNDVLAILTPGAEQLPPAACKPLTPGAEGITICHATSAAANQNGSILLWGDSHAGMLNNAIANLVAPDREFISAITPACPPLANAILGGRGQNRNERCRRHNEQVLSIVVKGQPKIDTAILAARWAYYAEGTRMPFETGEPVILGGGDVTAAPHILETTLKDTISHLLRKVDRVVIIAPFPEFDRAVTTNLARAKAWQQVPLNPPSRSTIDERQRTARAALRAVAESNPQRIMIASPLPYFCDDTQCQFADADGTPLFSDTNHVNTYGISKITPLLEKIVSQQRWYTGDDQSPER